MIEFKHNYFLINMIDLDKSLSQYLKDSVYNYVIIENNNPLIFAGDKMPIIFGGIEDVEHELLEADLIGNPNVNVINERDFIKDYCFDAINDWVKSKTLEYGEYDGNYHILWFTPNLYNKIKIDDYTDILAAYVNPKEEYAHILVADEYDKKQTWIDLDEFNTETIINIIAEMEHFVEYN